MEIGRSDEIETHFEVEIEIGIVESADGPDRRITGLHDVIMKSILTRQADMIELVSERTDTKAITAGKSGSGTAIEVTGELHVEMSEGRRIGRLAEIETYLTTDEGEGEVEVDEIETLSLEQTESGRRAPHLRPRRRNRPLI